MRKSMIRISEKKKWIVAGAAMGWVWIALWSWGCAGSTAAQTARDKDRLAQQAAQSYPPDTYQRRQPAPPSDGSLWQDNGGLGQMFVNVKARRIGDIITVRIVETSSAANKASTSTDRKSSVTGGLTNFFNMEQGYASDRPFFNPFSSVKASLESDFEGAGSTVRSGALNAYMTARIIDILPSGNLFIEGNREVRVNNENQIITLTGLVRPQDISSDNVVQSTYIADARISYSGTGIVDDRQRPGWLMRLLDKIWPF
jgi:flagellar L-ring protein precursor FlgH